mmetsp:Transcript_25841/g.65153  ORF Transcript_25841/g.65153 Transcript_25841/m.65153 type:complete len:107 (-) Transcript_25841:2604-2924(-)
MYPVLQMQFPFEQTPLALHAGSQVPTSSSGRGGASARFSQFSPEYPASHTHTPGWSQLPCPLQQLRAAQSMPLKPSKHMHCPLMQCPLWLHSFGQLCWQLSPLYPG